MMYPDVEHKFPSRFDLTLTNIGETRFVDTEACKAQKDIRLLSKLASINMSRMEPAVDDTVRTVQVDDNHILEELVAYNVDDTSP